MPKSRVWGKASSDFSKRTTSKNSKWHGLQWRRLYYIILHYITSHYITLQHIPSHCITLHYITLHYITLHCITLHYTALHYTALHYITLHYITLHYTALHYTALHYIILHYIIFYYITLHYTSTHYIALHYTHPTHYMPYIHCKYTPTCLQTYKFTHTYIGCTYTECFCGLEAKSHCPLHLDASVTNVTVEIRSNFGSILQKYLPMCRHGVGILRGRMTIWPDCKRGWQKTPFSAESLAGGVQGWFYAPAQWVCRVSFVFHKRHWFMFAKTYCFVVLLECTRRASPVGVSMDWGRKRLWTYICSWVEPLKYVSMVGCRSCFKNCCC